MNNPVRRAEGLALTRELFAKEEMQKELQKTIDAVRLLQNELDAGIEVLLPIVVNYLDKLRSMRMAFAREVQEILRSTLELKEVAKTSREIGELATSINKLKDILTPETVTLLTKLFGNK